MLLDAVVTLSWPPRQLNPNVVVHWAQKARVTKKARNEAFLLMKSELCRLAKEGKAVDKDKVSSVKVSYLFVPPDRRPRDDDNLIRCMKPFRDGIAQAIGVDDNCFRTCECDFGKPSRPAFVVAHLRIEVKDD